jgi:site-specific recombinase XerD
LKDGAIVIESAKKRKTGVHRPVPVPPAFLDMLNMVHNVRAAQKRRALGKSVRLWNWSRTKCWYVVSAVMKTARIAGPHATPKRLRHGFGSRPSPAVPLNTLQQLFGHAQLSTTSI